MSRHEEADPSRRRRISERDGLSVGFRLGQVLLVAGLAVLFTGCASLPPVDQASSSDLLDLSRPLQGEKFRLSEKAKAKRVSISIANSSDAASGLGESSSYGEIARNDLVEIFANCDNYVLASRSVNRQAAAETKLRESNATRQNVPGGSVLPVTPDYIIKATVMQVERAIKSDGTKTAWQYVISGEISQARRQGAVEVMVEITKIDNLSTVFVDRAYALLYDETKEMSGSLVVLSGAKKSSKRVPERQAIRTACQEAAMKMHQYFGSL
jgi:hypothetical protein